MKNIKKTLKNKKGFTLIEMIVVIAILAILSSILIPSVTGYIDQAKATRDMANARTIYTEYALADALGNSDGFFTKYPDCSADDGISSFECAFDSGVYRASKSFVREEE